MIYVTKGKLSCGINNDLNLWKVGNPYNQRHRAFVTA